MQNTLNSLFFGNVKLQLATCREFLANVREYVGQFITVKTADEIVRDLRVSVNVDISWRAADDCSFVFDVVSCESAEDVWNRIFEQEPRLNEEYFYAHSRVEVNICVMDSWRVLFNVFDGVYLEHLVRLVDGE